MILPLAPRPALALAAILPALAACVPREMVQTQTVDDVQLVSATSGNAVSVMRGKGETATICPRLGPDTATDRSGGFIGSVKAGGSPGVAGGSSSDNEVELIGRTPVVVLTRDTLFTLCVMHQNGILSDADFLRMMEKYLDRGYALAAEETKATTIQIGDAADTNILPSPGLGFSTGSLQAPTAPAPAPAPGPAGPPTAKNPL